MYNMNEYRMLIDYGYNIWDNRLCNKYLGRYSWEQTIDEEYCIQNEYDTGQHSA